MPSLVYKGYPLKFSDKPMLSSGSNGGFDGSAYIVIDYFDGVHFHQRDGITITGISPTEVKSIPVDNSVYDGSEYFNLSKSPFTEMPCALFNETNTYTERTYSGLGKYASTGVTIEWYSRMSNNSAWVHQWFRLNTYFHIMRTYNSNTYFTGYTNGSYVWDSTGRAVYTAIGKDRTLTSWHHFAITCITSSSTNSNVVMKLYIDGVYQLSYTIRSLDSFTFNGAIRDANSFGTKTGSYEAAKFIISDGIKYTGNFTPTTELEGFV